MPQKQIVIFITNLRVFGRFVTINLEKATDTGIFIIKILQLYA